MDRNEEQNGRVQLEFLDRNIPLDLAVEVNLPDYRSEISRLLWVRPTFLPPTRFIGGGKADFSGACRYDILYIGPDGALYSAAEEGNYAFSVPFEMPVGFESAAGAELSVEPVADAIISRVMGPRKLSVRCRMHARVCGYGEKQIDVRLKGEGDARERVLRLCNILENGRLFAGGSESFDLSDTVENESGELRLAASYGELFLPEVSVGVDSVRCRGEAVVTLLYCREGEEAAPFSVVRRIPFEREIALEGAGPDCRGRVSGGIGSITANIEEGKTLLDLQVTLAAEAQSEEELALCRDVYLPGQSAEPNYREEHFWRAGLCSNRNFSLSGEFSAAEAGIPDGAEILCGVADAEIKEKQSEGDRTTLSGDVNCHVLYLHDGEYGVAELLMPWRTVAEGRGEDLFASATVPICRVTRTRDGLRADVEVQMAMRGVWHESARVLAEVEFRPAEPRTRADLEICYPAAGDTLWEIGKRYGVSPDDLAGANGLSGDAPGEESSLAGVKYLLIP